MNSFNIKPCYVLIDKLKSHLANNESSHFKPILSSNQSLSTLNNKINFQLSPQFANNLANNSLHIKNENNYKGAINRKIYSKQLGKLQTTIISNIDQPLLELVKFRLKNHMKSCPVTSLSNKLSFQVIDCLNEQNDKLKNEQGNVPRYECSQCPKVFFKKRTFLSHFNKHLHSSDLQNLTKPNDSGDTNEMVITTTSNLPQEMVPKDNAIVYQDSVLGGEITPANSDSTTFYCPKCPHLEPFSSLARLNKHIAKHTRPFVCEICLKRFSRRDSLINHLRLCAFVPELMVNNDVNQASSVCCEECGSVWHDIPSYRRHGLTHTNPYPCGVCGSRFARSTTLTDHSCHPTLYQCSLCGGQGVKVEDSHSYTFPNVPLLEEHLLTIHRTEPVHRCSTCGRKFCLKLTLDDHVCHAQQQLLQRIGYAMESDYKENPTFSTASISALKDSVPSILYPEYGSTYLGVGNCPRKSKVSNLDPYICEVCGQKFSSPNTLKSHKTIHGERMYKCEVCGKRFHRRDTLKVHNRVHEINDTDATNPFTPSAQDGGSNALSNQRRFQCSICSKVVKSKNALDTHLKLHRSEQGYQCNVCLRRFLQKGNLQKHKNTHAQQRYSCPLCQKVFSSKEYCAHHIREHTEEKKFACPDCGKKYLLRHRMLDHHARAHTSNAYDCPFCEARIKMRHSLKRHWKRKHAKMIQVWDRPGYLESLEPSGAEVDHSQQHPGTSVNAIFEAGDGMSKNSSFQLYPHLYVQSGNEDGYQPQPRLYHSNASLCSSSSKVLGSSNNDMTHDGQRDIKYEFISNDNRNQQLLDARGELTGLNIPLPIDVSHLINSLNNNTHNNNNGNELSMNENGVTEVSLHDPGRTNTSYVPLMFLYDQSNSSSTTTRVSAKQDQPPSYSAHLISNDFSGMHHLGKDLGVESLNNSDYITTLLQKTITDNNP